MKTKVWIVLTAALVLICLGLTLWLFRSGQPASTVKIISHGKVLYTLPLSAELTLQVPSESGFNTITIRDGKVAVTEADCPDGYCMTRGFCDGGAQIVCLPNRLVIQFSGEQAIDGVAG